MYIQRAQFLSVSSYLDYRSSFCDLAGAETTTTLTCPGSKDAAAHLVGWLYNCSDSALDKVETADSQLLLDIIMIADYFSMSFLVCVAGTFCG